MNVSGGMRHCTLLEGRLSPAVPSSVLDGRDTHRGSDAKHRILYVVGEVVIICVDQWITWTASYADILRILVPDRDRVDPLMGSFEACPDMEA